jgi:uncharacterized protein (UPF0303 family)
MRKIAIDLERKKENLFFFYISTSSTINTQMLAGKIKVVHLLLSEQLTTA